MMYNLKLKKYCFIFLLLFLASCGSTTYYSDRYEFFKGQNDVVIHDPKSYVKVCSSFFVKQAIVKSMAYKYCSKTNRVPHFVEKRYYTDCSLLSPVTYVYNCAS